MARGRGGGLPPRRAGPALHTNQAPAGGRDRGQPRATSAPALARLLPPAASQLPRVVKVQAGSRRHSLPTRAPHHIRCITMSSK